MRTFLKISLWIAVLTVTLAFSCILTSCQRQADMKDQTPTKDIIAVQEAHTSELMAIPGVTGTAIGELDDHTPCILILVEEETPELKAKIPTRIEGHPTKLYVTGKIVPMDSN